MAAASMKACVMGLATAQDTHLAQLQAISLPHVAGDVHVLAAHQLKAGCLRNSSSSPTA
jgi:hypothetical protein